MKSHNLGRVVGLSAYEIAVSKGYDGSIEEWLESLRYDHSDEYKQFTKTIEQARNEIETGKSDIETSVSTIRDLVTNALTDIEESCKDGIETVNTAGTLAVNDIASKKSSALTDINATESKALTSLANALTSAVRNLNEQGTRWEQQIENAGELAQFNYNQNAEMKLSSYNKNVTEKTSAFDTYVSEAQTAFDQNAEQKIQEYDSHTEQIQADIGQLKEDFTAETATRKEDVEKLSHSKISKFYASNQGKTHLADSDNGKIMDMMLYGKSEQKQYRGKNLLPTTMYSDSVVMNGVTFISNGDGSITAKGTATDITYFTLFGYNQLGDKGILPGLKVGDTVSTSDCLLQETNSKELLKITENGTTTINSSTTTMYVGIRINKGESVNKTFYPQIEKGSEATSYEPYVGGQPSPSPDYPQEIKSVVNPSVKVTNEDGLKVQSVTLNNITLNAISVSSGGNVTIDGKQYIADYVDVERGKYVQMIQTDKVQSNITWTIQKQQKGYSLGYAILYKNGIPTNKPGMGKTWKSNVGDSSDIWSNVFSFGLSGVFWIVPYENDGNITSNDINAWLVEHPMDIMYPLAEPIETDLTPEENEAFKALVTNYPATNISVTSDQLDGYTVFNYPISMENGWNYVKQQIGDNRDYIYSVDSKTQDIDTQAAEAYVNSEYAVALTELEV